MKPAQAKPGNEEGDEEETELKTAQAKPENEEGDEDETEEEIYHDLSRPNLLRLNLL